MKRLALIIAASAVAFPASAQTSTNNPALTFTNGITLTLPLNDADFSALAYIRRATGQTNTPLHQIATNYTVESLSPRAASMLAARRAAILRRVSAASDAQLSAVEAALR